MHSQTIKYPLFADNLGSTVEVIMIVSLPFSAVFSTLLTIGMCRNTAGFGSTLAFGIHPVTIQRTAFTALMQSAENEDEAEFVYSRRRRRGRRNNEEDDKEHDSVYGKTEKEVDLEDDAVDFDYDVQDEYNDDDDDIWDDDEEEYDMFGNDIIPNPILDSMDPDGAAERFPELARDPRFWFDMLLFVTFLDLLSIIGPRDPYPDIPWL